MSKRQAFSWTRQKKKDQNSKIQLPNSTMFLIISMQIMFHISIPEYNHVIKQNSTTESKPEYGSSKKSTQAHGLQQPFKKKKQNSINLLIEN